MKASATVTQNLNGTVTYSITLPDGTIETRNSKVAYGFANIWKIEGYTAELSRKPGRPGRINQYGWLLTTTIEIKDAS